jgi:serine/threonine-protein kinase SRK2
VAIKFWPRDPAYINKGVQRELHNHSKFKHPNIIQFREVFLTPTHVGLVMEYASGGDLFKKVKKSKGLSVSAQHRTVLCAVNTEICSL